MWDVYRLTALYNLETTGQEHFKNGDPELKYSQWPTPAGRIPCITEEERAFALHTCAEAKAGRLHLVIPKKMQPPEYAPSGINWAEVDRQISGPAYQGPPTYTAKAG
jgi:hypothetical protein